MRTKLIWVAALFVLGSFFFMVRQKEAILRDGQTVYLELAPVDPRSLMQGDYMALNYAMLRPFRQWAWDTEKQELPQSGTIVIQLDEHNTGTFVRLHQGEPLASNERLLRFHHVRGRPAIGAESYFFQEGTASYYAQAKYGELKVSADGTPLLVALCDNQFDRKGAPSSSK